MHPQKVAFLESEEQNLEPSFWDSKNSKLSKKIGQPKSYNFNFFGFVLSFPYFLPYAP